MKVFLIDSQNNSIFRVLKKKNKMIDILENQVPVYYKGQTWALIAFFMNKPVIKNIYTGEEIVVEREEIEIL